MLKKTLINSYLIFITLTLSNGVFAQDSSGQWTLSNCIRYALDNNIQVKKSAISISQGISNYRQARAALLPSLSASAGESFTSRKILDAGTGIYSPENAAGGSYGLHSEMTVYNGNSLRNNIKLKSLEIITDSLLLEESKNNIEIAITQAYMQVLFARESVKLAEANEEASKLQLEQYKNLFDAGSIAENDYAQLQSQFSTDHYKLITARNNLSQQLLSLKQLLEMDYTKSINVAYPDLSDSIVTVMLPEKNSVFITALEVMPDLKYSEIDIRKAELNYKTAKAGIYPSVSLSAGLSTGYGSNVGEPFGSQLDHGFYKNAGISVSLPIYSNRQNKSNIEMAKYNIELAKLNYQDNKKALLQDVETTWLSAETSLGRFNAAISQLRSAEFSYQLAEQKFKAGLTDAVALVNAKTIYLSAQQEYLMAKYSAILNCKLLDFYQGKSIVL